MEKIDLTVEQALEVAQILRKEKLYDGIIPSLDDEKKLIDLASEYVNYSLMAIKDGNALPVTTDILRAGGYDDITGEKMDTPYIPDTDISELVEEKIEEFVPHLPDIDSRVKFKPEVKNMEVRTGVKTASKEGAEAFASQFPTEEEADKKEFVGSDWLKVLNKSTKDMNLPIPEAMDETDIPKLPRDISSHPTKTVHKLYGQFNSALALANYQAALAQVDAKNYKLLRDRKLNELTKDYLNQGNSKAAAKELALADSSYEDLNDKFSEQDAKRTYFEKLADIYSKNVEVLSRSLTFRMEETK